jgi:hypothetical protein
MNPSRIGSIAEAKVLATASTLGWNVSIPFGDGLPYDLVVEREGKLYRVQCKTGRLRDGVVKFADYSDDHKSYDGLVDVIAVFCHQNEKLYWIPASEGGMAHLRIDPPKNGQRKKIRYAKDFEVGV